MDKLSIINHTITKGFPWLLFPSPLESDFQGLVRQRILNRVLHIGISASIFVLIFSVLDWFMLHPNVAMHTSFIRLGLVMPVIIIATLWLYFKPPSYYLWIYSATLSITGLSIIYIIWLAHSQGINLPYEGLMIVMMYGFFIMALPFYLALSINIIMVVIYALSEPFLHLNFTNYINNVLFLSVVLISAAIGAYVTEHSQRANFLRKRTLDILHHNTLQSIQQKNKYLAAASHDIRQPLQGIALMGEVLKQSQPNNIHVQHLNLSISTLNAMFTQMLDISKINLNLLQPKIDQFSLLDLIEQNTQGFTPRFKQHNIQLTMDIRPCSINSDFTMLSRVLHNLIENTLNHSQCSKIIISSTLIKNIVELSVKDNGQGISKNIQASIFDEFIKGTDSQNGLGLGLTIVSQFCKKLNHPLRFTSQAGETLFTIQIPLADGIMTENINSHNDNKILLIDDDQTVLRDLEEMFTSWGYQVTCVNGIQHAMNTIKQDWHCVISDWNLGDGCGEDIIKYCYKNSIPSILISSNKSKDLLRLAQDYNSQLLQKPISPSRLRAKLLSIK